MPSGQVGNLPHADQALAVRGAGSRPATAFFQQTPRALPMTPRLLAISGPIKGSEFPLSPGEFTLGRESSNAIWLEHPSVSRRHCRVRVTDGSVAILDLDSRNGTFVNRIPI